MSDLARLEQDFQDFVLDGAAGIEQSVVNTARVPVAKRLAIYSDAYRARLAEALDNNFPVLGKLLGDAQFTDLAGRFVRRQPSAHYSIRWYGARLADFLAAEEPYRGRALLTELARWEWSMTLAFDAADAQSLTASALETLAPEQWADLVLKLHPSAQRLSLRTNAPAVWRAINREEAPPEFAGSEARAWLIWRRGLDTFFRSLDSVEAGALDAVGPGTSFGALCETLARELGDDRAAEEAAKLLRRWLDDELLTA